MPDSIKRFSVSIVFSSIFVILSLIPIGTSFIGGIGRFQLSIILPPLTGWLIGPYYGSMSMAIGSIISGFFFPTSPFGFMGCIIPASGALFAGFIRRDRSILSAVYLIAFALLFSFVYPIAWWFTIPHLFAALLCILTDLVNSHKVQVLFGTFSSTFSQQATGTILTILLLKLTAEDYFLILPLTMYERTIAAVGSFLLILAVERRLKTSYIFP
ncbi:MAG: hypothetical protein QXJ17_01945 [Nitrososphaeria archaeon]